MLGNSPYLLTFVDEYSRKTFVYFLKLKCEEDQRVREFVDYVERQTGDKVRHLRSDDGGEYGSKALNDFLKQWGILFQKTEPCTPKENRIAERTNSVLMDKSPVKDAVNGGL